MGANDLVESLLDGGKTPFELVRDMCYGEEDKGLQGHVDNRHVHESLTEDLTLTPASKKVIAAFLDKKSAEGNKLISDGKVLSGLWMGGNKLAWWEVDKIKFRPLDSRSQQTVVKYIRKTAPKNDLGESLDEATSYSLKKTKATGSHQGDEWLIIVKGKEVGKLRKMVRKMSGKTDWLATSLPKDGPIKTGDSKDKPTGDEAVKALLSQLGESSTEASDVDDLLQRIGALLGRKPMSEAKKYDPAYLAVEVVDTKQDEKEGGKVIQHVRGDGKHEERFNDFLKRYKYPRYVVQIIDNKSDKVIKDNQGSGGKVRSMESTLPVSTSELDEAELKLTPDGSDEEAAVMEFLTALEAAQVPFSLDEREEEGVLVVRWPEAHSRAVEDALEATGIVVTEDEDSSDVHAATLSGQPHADLPSLFERDRKPKASSMIDAVINGESIEDVLARVSEASDDFGEKSQSLVKKHLSSDELKQWLKPMPYMKRVDMMHKLRAKGTIDDGVIQSVEALRKKLFKAARGESVSEATKNIPPELSLTKLLPKSMFKGWEVDSYDDDGVSFSIVDTSKKKMPGLGHPSKASFAADYGKRIDRVTGGKLQDSEFELTYYASVDGSPMDTNRIKVKTKDDLKPVLAVAKKVIAKVK